jgi:hypothetical protein
MKNLLIFALVLTANFSFAQITFVSQFIQTTDTLVLTGIDSNEVKVELAEYACNVRVESVVTLVNEKEFSDDTVIELNKMAIAEAIENENRIASRLDKFRTANVKIGGRTPNIERVVTVYVKQGTVLKYN